jgi:hypothetical protein
MAAAQVQPHRHGRHRSISDPFSDPAHVVTQLAQVPRTAPVPPPKNSGAPPPRPPKSYGATAGDSNGYSDRSRTGGGGSGGDPSPRAKMHRSQTSVLKYVSFVRSHRCHYTLISIHHLHYHPFCGSDFSMGG